MYSLDDWCLLWLPEALVRGVVLGLVSVAAVLVACLGHAEGVVQVSRYHHLRFDHLSGQSVLADSNGM